MIDWLKENVFGFQWLPTLQKTHVLSGWTFGFYVQQHSGKYRVGISFYKWFLDIVW